MKLSKKSIGGWWKAVAVVGVVGWSTLTPWIVQAQQGRPDHELRLALLPGGFAQREVTVPAGNVLLVLKNQSYTDRISLSLDREAGAQARAVPLSAGRSTWREAINLTPGRYVLTVNGYEKWRCRITVTAK